MGNAPERASRRPSLTGPAFHILLALADGDRHGYGIMREVEARTEGRVRLGPGTLYGAIKRLRTLGLIEEAGARPAPDADDERRRYYRLTARGWAAAVAEAERLARLVDAARAKALIPRPGPA